MSTESPSVFTRIINGEIPANIVHETDRVIAFLTIDPLTPGHTLVVPKTPFVNVFDADEAILGEMMKTAKLIATAMRTAGLAEGVNLLMNNEKAAGQEVFHAHLHVIPRTKPHEAITTLDHYQYQTGEAASTAESIANAIQ